MTPTDDCKCGIRRADCEYHKPEAGSGDRDPLVYAHESERVLPAHLTKELKELLRHQSPEMIAWLTNADKDRNNGDPA